MKRILLLTTVFMMMLGTSFSSAQTDADNFYKSDLVSVEKVSFSNQYKMKVAGNLFLPKNMKEGASSQIFLCSRADLLIHVVQIRKGMDGFYSFFSFCFITLVR